eukprot:2702325-Pyramimonas_sp.AAC.1
MADEEAIGRQVGGHFHGAVYRGMSSFACVVSMHGYESQLCIVMTVRIVAVHERMSCTTRALGASPVRATATIPSKFETIINIGAKCVDSSASQTRQQRAPCRK